MSDGYPPNYYAGLSNLKFQPIMPLSGLITGIEAGQQIEQTALRNAMVRQGMEQAKVEEGRKTALFPEQLNEAQVKTALDISKYADEVLPRTTYESYPGVRDDVLKKFPSLSTHFPDPGQFKSAADFDNWKTAAWRLQAQLKALPQIITAASREKVATIGAGSRERAAALTAASRERAAETGAAGRIGAARVGAAAKASDPKPFSTFIQDPNIAELPKAEQVKRFNETYATSRETPGQKVTREQKEVKTDLMRKLGGSGKTPPTSVPPTITEGGVTYTRDEAASAQAGKDLYKSPSGQLFEMSNEED